MRKYLKMLQEDLDGPLPQGSRCGRLAENQPGCTGLLAVSASPLRNNPVYLLKDGHRPSCFPLARAVQLSPSQVRRINQKCS